MRAPFEIFGKALDLLDRASLFEVEEELAFSELDHFAFDFGSGSRRDGDDRRSVRNGWIRGRTEEEAHVFGSAHLDHSKPSTPGYSEGFVPKNTLDSTGIPAHLQGHPEIQQFWPIVQTEAIIRSAARSRVW